MTNPLVSSNGLHTHATQNASTVRVKPSSGSKPSLSPPKPSPTAKGKQKAKQINKEKVEDDEIDSSPKAKGQQKAKKLIKKEKVEDEEADGFAASADEGEDELEADEDIDSDDDTGVASKMYATVHPIARELTRLQCRSSTVKEGGRGCQRWLESWRSVRLRLSQSCYANLEP